MSRPDGAPELWAKIGATVILLWIMVLITYVIVVILS